MFDDVVDATIEIVFELLDSLEDVADVKGHLAEVAKDVIARTFKLLSRCPKTVSKQHEPPWMTRAP